MLRAAGVERVNVSLDTLDPEKFRTITRNGRLDDVLGGIDAAAAAGLRVKINMVALAGVNDDEILPMIAWCGARGHDLTFIETMPMGAVDAGRVDQYLPLDAVRRAIGHEYALEPLFERTGGPARYARIAETGQKLGFITPLSDNFCESCNRVRVTATGTLFMCLGQEGRVELRDVLRNEGPDALDRALDRAMAQKPRGHDFVIAEGAPAVSRHMSVTGG
jgi:cyclic pyranopterin phosphate synthase